MVWKLREMLICFYDALSIFRKTKNLKNIFKRYFRENYLENEGFWIGLNLVKKVCDINKWEIKIDSQKNKYSSFSIKFE